MRMNRIAIISLMLTVISPGIDAQEINFLDEFAHQFEIQEHKHNYANLADYSNELKSVTSLMFLFYKEFISSQDVNSCVFTPSCSVYALEAIKKKGFLIGGMAALDRLTRCSGLAYGYYDIDKKTKLNIDPVE